MPKFFQSEIAAYNGTKTKFTNVKFKKGDFENSDAAAAGTLLEVIPVHIKNPPVIQFIAYVDSLSDSFSPEYTAEQPFGRTDPYYIWKGSKRTIGVGWSIPSSSKTTALENMNNLSWLLASLYPAYKESNVATSIAASPLFRVRHANLISSTTAGGQGILCTMTGVKITHDGKAGFISISPKNSGSPNANVDAQIVESAGFGSRLKEGDKLLVPKLIKINVTLNVVHDHPLGWDVATGNWRGGTIAPGFPYNFGVLREAPNRPATPAPAAPPIPGSPKAKEDCVIGADLTKPPSGKPHPGLERRGGCD